MLILCRETLAEMDGGHPLLDWPGLLCLWARADGEAGALARDALTVEFDPMPDSLAAVLRACIDRLSYFGHDADGPILCASRVPSKGELDALRQAGAKDPWAVAAPKRQFWHRGGRIDGIVMLGAGFAAGPALARALRTLDSALVDADGIAAFRAIGRDLDARGAART